jgi:2-polyprenyl-3-methyl-5-hydroxy-6-metoxy-1,4-benzoquinol methylase
MRTRCPLCDGASAKCIESIPFERIWAALKDEWGATFSEAVIARHTPAGTTDLCECLNCGLQYFSPAQPGDPEFYRQLTTTSPAYYSADKWDFGAAATMLTPSVRVLDIACGSGQFLEMARSRGAAVCGIDTNPDAVESARGKGLPAHCVELADFARDHREGFEVVTAFQVVEHVPCVLPFVRSALECLEPGGKLILTVPNRLRRFRGDLEPLDCPPHHLSRWTSNQFHALARAVGCRVARVQYETVSLHDCRALLRSWLAGRRSEDLWVRAIARVCFSSSLYRVYTSAGLLDRFGLWRLSIMCSLEKPR